MEAILKNEELAVFKLRSLYSKYGYTQYKMSTFEEYDLYVRNKDFLISDRVITFTDTNGKLLALKPDVTLSIINHLGNENKVQKLYYNENVYRVSGESKRFKEIMQTGLECVGNIGVYEICEVTSLACESLKAISSQYMLELSHAGIVLAYLKEIGLNDENIKTVNEYICLKNEGAINQMALEAKITKEQAEKACVLINNYTDISKLESDLLLQSDEGKNAFNEFKTVINVLSQSGFSANITINFSLSNNMRYYSGIVFKGYIKGIPTGVLSGGQYDALMRKLKKNSSAIGFAVYLDGFERLNNTLPEYDVDFILVIDKTEEPINVLSTQKELSKNGETVLVCYEIPEKIKYKRAVKLHGKEFSDA